MIRFPHKDIILTYLPCLHCTPETLKLPLPQPNLHPLLPHGRQPPHALARLRRVPSLKHHFVFGSFLVHGAVPIQQLDAGVLGDVFGAQCCRGLERREPGAEGDGVDGCAVGGGVVEVLDRCWDEGAPFALVGVDEVVVAQVCRCD